MSQGLIEAGRQSSRAGLSRRTFLKFGLTAGVTATGGLRDLTVGLPIAGASGTLAPRFKPSDPAAVGGRGWVRAKTGSLESTYALAGVVLDVDGRVLTFAFVSNGVNQNTTRPAQDALATVLRNCGCT